MIAALRSYLAKRIPAAGQPSFVLAFTGAAGLGKTHAARVLARSFQPGTVAHVRLDGFLVDRATRHRTQTNGYRRSGWRLAEARAALTRLIAGRQTVAIPLYTPGGEVAPGPPVSLAPLLILDGNLVLLDASVRSLVSELVYFDAEPATMRALRRERDTTIERRFTDDEADRVWSRELPALRRNILPGRALASVVVVVERRGRFGVVERGPTGSPSRRATPPARPPSPPSGS